jgi:hypothetical protein
MTKQYEDADAYVGLLSKTITKHLKMRTKNQNRAAKGNKLKGQPIKNLVKKYRRLVLPGINCL